MPPPARANPVTVLAAIGLLLANRALLAARLRRRRDGWRRAACLMLRDEVSMFVLSAFGLDAWSDTTPRPLQPTAAQTQAHIAARLEAFLPARPACHICIIHGEHEDRIEPVGSPAYTLAFEPWREGPDRFRRPDRWAEATPGAASSGLLNVVCRASADGCTDIWLRINHAGADGVPMQEMLTRLEQEWGGGGGGAGGGGGGGEVCYPAPDAFAPRASPLAARPDLCEIQTFIDFAPLLAWRKRENARLPSPMTLSAAILWCLAHHPAFAAIDFGTTVEVGASAMDPALPRGVGVVVVRPSDYFKRTDGLARYVADFNHEMELTRRRASRACKNLDAAALMPAPLAGALLSHALVNTTKAFGTLGLTMLKDARVFCTPIGPVGHAHGFIAIGSVALNSTGGGKVGCVSIKGPKDVVATYPALIRQAIERCGKW